MHRVVPALEQARSQRGRKAKVAAVAAAFRAVAADGDDEDLATAARLVAGELLPRKESATLGVGFALVMTAACDAYGLSSKELGARARVAGDLGDAVGALAARDASGVRLGLSLAELRALGAALAATTDRAVKTALLTRAYGAARPDQAMYLTKALLGELRIGVREGVLEEAIAAAFGRDAKTVQSAATLCPDPGELTVLASHDELACAVFVIGVPVAFMLASPIENVKAPLDAGATLWEDKLDGIRVQVHAKREGFVRLFARGGGEVSGAFPEVARAFEAVPRDVVLDGELLAVSPDLGPRPFQALQARVNRKDPDAALLARTPVALFAFDMLYDGEPLLDRPLSVRREHLARFLAEAKLSPHAQATVAHPFDATQPLEPQIDAAYREARARGHEGLVLKDSAATYEAGKRGSAWRKVKRAVATLDVVITRVEQGHGKRAHVLSDYTFAVWKGEGGERALVDIGKAYSGLTDVEIAALTEELRATAWPGQSPDARIIIVQPTIVLEVAFDGLQRSPRHASGLALRFPRILRIRRDKTPDDADSLATAQALLDAQVASGHREEERPVPAPKKTAKPTEAAPRKQLALFDVAVRPKKRSP